MPIFSILCNSCLAIHETVLEVNETLKCPVCGSTDVEKLVSQPASFNFNCEIQTASKGKPTTDHPKGSNFLFGREKDRVKKEKKEMNKALNSGKNFHTGVRKKRER